MPFRKRVPSRLIVLLLVAWGFLTVRIDAPFFGHHDANGVWISAAARNWRLYGVDQLGLIPVVNRSAATPDTFSAYGNHPPLVVYAIAVSIGVLGETELAARLIPALCTLVSSAAFYTLARRLWDDKTAFWSAGFYALTPMLLYFGRMPNHEAPALMFIALFGVVLQRWIKRPSRAGWIALATLIVCGVWTAWGAVLLMACLTIAALFLVERGRRFELSALGIVALLALALLMAVYEASSPGSVSRLLGAFSLRSSNVESFYQPAADFTLIQWLQRQLGDIVLFFTPPVLMLGGFGVWRIVRRGTPIQRAFTVALALAALAYVIILRNAVYEHDFYKIYFAPALAFGCAVVVRAALVRRSWQRRLVLISILLSATISVAVVVALHQFAARAQIAPMIIVDTLRTVTTLDDQISTDYGNLPIGIEYYAFREITGGVPEIEWLANGDGVYLRCSAPSPLADDVQRIASDAVCAYLRR